MMSISTTCLGDNIDGTMQYLTELFLRGREEDPRTTRLGNPLPTVAKEVDTGHWQSLSGVPQTKTIELTNVHLTFGGDLKPLPATVEGLQGYFKPNLPWAEDHFQERVSGDPLNPGEQFRNWPWYRSGVEDHKARGQFSHTYMERFWPRYAPEGVWSQKARQMSMGGQAGIRYRYGDLNDVLDLLAREPYTRQAYLPVWFPEDTGAHHRGRVPCTLGYHFMMRERKLHIMYPMRSLDFVRYARDDFYMAARLGLWVLEQLWLASGCDGIWNNVTLGELNVVTSSLHIFENDLPMLKRKGMPIMRNWEEDYVRPNQP